MFHKRYVALSGEEGLGKSVWVYPILLPKLLLSHRVLRLWPMHMVPRTQRHNPPIIWLLPHTCMRNPFLRIRVSDMGHMNSYSPTDNARKLGYVALMLFVHHPWLSLSEHF